MNSLDIGLIPELHSGQNTSSAEVYEILEKFLGGVEINVAEAIKLFYSDFKSHERLFEVADSIRKIKNGNEVSFVVNRNINFTNICHMGCNFCGFAKRINNSGAEWLELDEIVFRAKQAWDRGATEVCIQGGLHPKMKGTIYRDILIAIKAELPKIHIHAFSPFEIWYGASKMRMSYKEFLTDLKECGLGSIPGTAAEILDQKIRKRLTKNKLSTEKWIEIITTAHSLGIRSSATIMYGHIDGPEHWASHLDLLRVIQKKTGGFTEFVPLSFVHYESPLFTADPKNVRPGPTLDEVKKMHAISRIMLSGWIDNIQVSWTKLGPKLAQNMLGIGVNDLGGTLMNESISRAAGSNNGQEITSEEMVRLVRAVGKIPKQRNTLYETVEIFKNHDPNKIEPLIARKGKGPLEFLPSDYSRQHSGHER